MNIISILGSASMLGVGATSVASLAGLAMSVGNDLPSPTIKKRTPEEIAENKRHLHILILSKFSKHNKRYKSRLYQQTWRR